MPPKRAVKVESKPKSEPEPVVAEKPTKKTDKTKAKWSKIVEPEPESEPEPEIIDDKSSESDSDSSSDTGNEKTDMASFCDDDSEIADEDTEEEEVAVAAPAPKSSPVKTAVVTKPEKTQTQIQTKDDSDSDEIIVDPSKKKKSVLEFDHNEINRLDKKVTKDLDNNTLLKILMVRGIKSSNPVLFNRSRGALLEINMEQLPKNKYEKRQSSETESGGAARPDYSASSPLQRPGSVASAAPPRTYDKPYYTPTQPGGRGGFRGGFRGGRGGFSHSGPGRQKDHEHIDEDAHSVKEKEPEKEPVSAATSWASLTNDGDETDDVSGKKTQSYTHRKPYKPFRGGYRGGFSR